MAKNRLKSQHGVAKQTWGIKRPEVVLAIGAAERAVEMDMSSAEGANSLDFGDDFAANFGVFETAFAF